MKKTLSAFLLFIVICAGFSAKVLAQNDFGGIVSLDKTIHNFGVILLSDGEQKCTFTVTNIHKRPIIIHKVISSCGCAEPSWTKSPIMPGEKGHIDITFTNDQGPYPFDKAITVYISDLGKPLSLRVRGIVQEKKKSVKETYTEKFGAIGMTESKIDLGQVEQGLARNGITTIANISDRTIHISFTDITPGLSLSVEKTELKAGETTELRFVVDTKKTEGTLWGTTLFRAKFCINGEIQQRKLGIETLIKENFSTLSKEERRIGSLPYFEESSFNFGSIAEGEQKEIVMNFTNNGKSDFVIYKVDCEEKGIRFEYPKNIRNNEKGQLKITLDSKGMKGEQLFIVTLITNSPLRPIINLLITGTIK